MVATNEQRLDDGMLAVYASMQRGNYKHAHELARTVVFGGDVIDPLSSQKADGERQRVLKAHGIEEG